MEEKEPVLPEGQQDNPRSVKLPFRPADDKHFRPNTAPDQPKLSLYHEQRVSKYDQKYKHRKGPFLRPQVRKNINNNPQVWDLREPTDGQLLQQTQSVLRIWHYGHEETRLHHHL